VSSPQAPPKPDALDAILGADLDAAKQAPGPDPLAENPKLAEAIADAVALSGDGNAFGPVADDGEPVRDAP